MPSSHSRAIALVSQVRRALAKADTLEDLKRVRDEAEAVRCLAQKAKLGLQMQNEAAEFKLRAERKAGEMLSVLTRRGRRGTQMYQVGTFRLEELGISRNQSSRWQREAAVPEEEFSAFLKTSQDTGREVSAEALLRLCSVRRRGLRSRRSLRPQVLDACRNGDHYLVAETIPVVNDSAAKDRDGSGSVSEVLAELKNHHATLAGVLLPFLELRQSALTAPVRRHAARLIREISLLHEVLGANSRSP